MPIYARPCETHMQKNYQSLHHKISNTQTSFCFRFAIGRSFSRHLSRTIRNSVHSVRRRDSLDSVLYPSPFAIGTNSTRVRSSRRKSGAPAFYLRCGKCDSKGKPMTRPRGGFGRELRRGSAISDPGQTGYYVSRAPDRMGMQNNDVVIAAR